MIPIKTPEEVAVMAEGGKILAQVLQKVLAKAVPGVTTASLDKYAEELIAAAGAAPSFKMEKGYQYATCMNVNDMVVHGIPANYSLQGGDILGVDLGVLYKGWHTDGSWTIRIAERIADNRYETKDRKIDNRARETERFLRTGEEALEAAIEECRAGRRVGDISRAMQKIVEGTGYGCVKQLVGHGIGRKLHEDPEIPCYLRGKAENTPLIREGMVFAIEVIYNQGKSPVVYHNDDGWTIVTRDGTPSGLFEHTVAVTARGPLILTR